MISWECFSDEVFRCIPLQRLAASSAKRRSRSPSPSRSPALSNKPVAASAQRARSTSPTRRLRRSRSLLQDANVSRSLNVPLAGGSADRSSTQEVVEKSNDAFLSKYGCRRSPPTASFPMGKSEPVLTSTDAPEAVPQPQPMAALQTAANARSQFESNVAKYRSVFGSRPPSGRSSGVTVTPVIVQLTNNAATVRAVEPTRPATMSVVAFSGGEMFGGVQKSLQVRFEASLIKCFDEKQKVSMVIVILVITEQNTEFCAWYSPPIFSSCIPCSAQTNSILSSVYVLHPCDLLMLLYETVVKRIIFLEIL